MAHWLGGGHWPLVPITQGGGDPQGGCGQSGGRCLGLGHLWGLAGVPPWTWLGSPSSVSGGSSQGPGNLSLEYPCSWPTGKCPCQPPVP